MRHQAFLLPSFKIPRRRWLLKSVASSSSRCRFAFSGLQSGEVTEIVGKNGKSSPTSIVLGTLSAIGIVVGAAILYKRKIGSNHNREIVVDDESEGESSADEEDYVIEITTE